MKEFYIIIPLGFHILLVGIFFFELHEIIQPSTSVSAVNINELLLFHISIIGSEEYKFVKQKSPKIIWSNPGNTLKGRTIHCLFWQCFELVINSCLLGEGSGGRFCSIIQHADHVCKHSFPWLVVLKQANALHNYNLLSRAIFSFFTVPVA